VLVLAEIHNVLAASWREQRVVFNTLRYLSNELKLSLVCFGIMEARQAINGDVQLARRFDSVSLSRWMAGKEFEQLVLAIVRNLPLKEPSVLTVKGLRRILLARDGVSARIFRMLNDVAIEAIETGVERITDEALERYKPVGGSRGNFPMIDGEDDAHRPLPSRGRTAIVVVGETRGLLRRHRAVLR